MSKFQIDLENYPRIQQLFERDKEEFARVLKTVLEHTDSALIERFDQAQEVYKMDYLHMLEQIMDAFFNVEGIAEKHHHSGEQEGLKALKHDLHPLAIFTNGATVYDVNGNKVTPSEWIQQGNFNLKDWLYGLFYGARFVSWHELASYLSLGKYDLLDVLAAQNFNQLSNIQPALEFQKNNGVPVGKLIPGTGFFDGGNAATRHLEVCPACASTDWILDHEKYAYCENCRLGGIK